MGEAIQPLEQAKLAVRDVSTAHLERQTNRMLNPTNHSRFAKPTSSVNQVTTNRENVYIS